MKERIWLSLAHMSGHEQKYIQDAFDTNWVVPLGPNVDGFEADISSFLNSDVYAAALSSGTAALHLGLILLGVTRGDEVLCQSFTFSATANPILYQGATPIFIDSEKDTWNMSPKLLRKAIEDRLYAGIKPKAILPVHLYGTPAKMDEIVNISNHYNIPILEDAAEALGSQYKGKMCGTFGDIAALSFNGNKIITTSGGGAIISKNAEYIEKAKFLATQARDKAPHYQHSQIGYNYRMSNICAGIGRGQMIVLHERVERRREINKLYVELFKNIDGIKVFQVPNADYFSNYWLTCIEIDSSVCGCTREDIRIGLEERNIETRPLWKPLHLQPVFEKSLFYIDGTSEKLFDTGLCLPSSSILSDDDIKKVVSSIKEIIK